MSEISTTISENQWKIIQHLDNDSAKGDTPVILSNDQAAKALSKATDYVKQLHQQQSTSAHSRQT